jgi:hypothetical protein
MFNFKTSEQLFQQAKGVTWKIWNLYKIKTLKPCIKPCN